MYHLCRRRTRRILRHRLQHHDFVDAVIHVDWTEAIDERNANTREKECVRKQKVLNRIEHLARAHVGQINTQRDTTPLTEREIQAAILANGNRIDKASKYEYLKNQKVDSTKNTQDVDKDSLKQGQ